jgi:hypothetical protein
MGFERESHVWLDRPNGLITRRSPILIEVLRPLSEQRPAAWISGIRSLNVSLFGAGDGTPSNAASTQGCVEASEIDEVFLRAVFEFSLRGSTSILGRSMSRRMGTPCRFANRNISSTLSGRSRFGASSTQSRYGRPSCNTGMPTMDCASAVMGTWTHCWSAVAMSTKQICCLQSRRSARSDRTDARPI